MADPGRVDRSAFAVVESFDAADAADRQFWWAQTPEARLQAAQYLREINYGDAATARLQRVLEFAERGGG
jgi:hypothetical protein